MRSVHAPRDPGHHRSQVALQQQIHETRRLLLEAADLLVDIDTAARQDQPGRSLQLLMQAAALTAASGRQLRQLEQRFAAPAPAPVAPGTRGPATSLTAAQDVDLLGASSRRELPTG